MSGSDYPPSVKPTEIEGTVTLQRSDRDQCICCEGVHIFGYYLTADDDAPPRVRRKHVDTGAALDVLDYATFVYDQIRRAPEGARVRITVEVVDG